MSAIILNVVVQGVLTGLVYGLMALGLSVIFGIVRVVNFAHGEFAVIAMYAAFLLFRNFGLDPLAAVQGDSAGIGSLIEKTAPGRSVRLPAAMVPCIASTKPREMASPRPVPARTWSPFCTR